MENVLFAFLVACGFASWPIIGSYSRASSAWVGMMVLVGSMLAMSPFVARQMAITIPSYKTIGILIFAGILNGLAVVMYTARTNDAVTAAIFVVMVSVFMVVVAPFVNWALNNQALNLNHIVGIFFAICAIFFLSR